MTKIAKLGSMLTKSVRETALRVFRFCEILFNIYGLNSTRNKRENFHFDISIWLQGCDIVTKGILFQRLLWTTCWSNLISVEGLKKQTAEKLLNKYFSKRTNICQPWAFIYVFWRRAEKVDFLALKEAIVLQNLHIAKNHGSPKLKRLHQS